MFKITYAIWAAVAGIIYLIYKHKIPVPCYGCDDMSNSIFFKCISFTGKDTIGCDTYKVGKEHAGEIVDDITNISNVISKSFTKIAGEVPNIIRNAITNIINLFKITLEKVWGILSTISTIIKTAFNKIINVFTTTYKYTKQSIYAVLKAFQDVIFTALVNPVNVIITQVINVKNIIIKTIGSAYNKILSIGSVINFDALDRIILMPINFFLRLLWRPVQRIYGKLKHFFEVAIWGLEKGASTAINGTVKGIVWYYNNPIKGVNEMIKGIETSINFFPRTFNNLKDEVMSGINKLKKPVTDTKDIVMDKVNMVKNYTIGKVKPPIDQGINIFHQARNIILGLPKTVVRGINIALNWPIQQMNTHAIGNINKLFRAVSNVGFTSPTIGPFTIIPSIPIPGGCWTVPRKCCRDVLSGEFVSQICNLMSNPCIGGSPRVCMGGGQTVLGVRIPERIPPNPIRFTIPSIGVYPFSFVRNFNIPPIPNIPGIPEPFKNIENFKEVVIPKVPLIPTPEIIPDPGSKPKEDPPPDSAPITFDVKMFGHLGDIFTDVKNFIWKLLSPITNFLKMLWGYRAILSEMLGKFFNAAYNLITKKIEDVIKFSKDQVFKVIPRLLYYYVINPIINLFVEIKNVVFKLISTIINNGIKLFKILKDNLEKIFKKVYVKIADLFTYYIKIIGGVLFYIYGRTAQMVVPGNYYPTTKIIIYTLGLAYLILGPFINTTLFLFS